MRNMRSLKGPRYGIGQRAAEIDGVRRVVYACCRIYLSFRASLSLLFLPQGQAWGGHKTNENYERGHWEARFRYIHWIHVAWPVLTLHFCPSPALSSSIVYFILRIICLAFLYTFPVGRKCSISRFCTISCPKTFFFLTIQRSAWRCRKKWTSYLRGRPEYVCYAHRWYFHVEFIACSHVLIP